MVRQLSATEIAPDREQVQSLWYPEVPEVKNRSAAKAAERICDAIRANDTEGLGEEQFFTALHTCAFRARQDAKRKGKGKDWLKWFRRWHDIRNHLIESNLGLVYSTIQRSNVRNADDDELLSDAFLALLNAVHRFNPWRGYRFSSYAVSAIHHALIYRGKHENRYRRLFPVTFETSLEGATRIDEASELYTERLHKVLRNNLGELTDLETHILAERFPQDERQRRTLRELSSTIGISKERVRQIQQRALEKIRRVMVADPVLQ